MSANVELRWDADDPDHVAIWADGHPIITTNLADLGNQLRQAEAKEWYHRIRQQAREYDAEDAVAMARARRRQQESSRRFEQVSPSE